MAEGLEEMISYYDENGRRVLVPRSDWAEKVLPENFQKTWDDPDALYQVIVGALGDGFLDCALPAIARLIEIDPNPERSSTILAAAQIKGGLLDAAERTLQAFIAKHGETGAALATLAKVRSAQGDAASAEDLLRRALSLDPNQDGALSAYAAIHKDRGGAEASRAALEDVAKESGAWRPWLRLGQLCLGEGDASKAFELFRRALGAAPGAAGSQGPRGSAVLQSRAAPGAAGSQGPRGSAVLHSRAAPGESDALAAVAGALERAGFHSEMLELAWPLYDPQKSSPYAALSLARGFFETGREKEGRELVNRLKGLSLAHLAEPLSRLERDFPEDRLPRPAQMSPPISLVRIPGPVWTRGLCEPLWLLPLRPASSPEIGFLCFADGMRKGDRAITRGSAASEVLGAAERAGAKPGYYEEAEDDRGRLSRALPLYLAEALTYKTSLRALCMVPLVPEKGPVVSGAWDVPALIEVGLWPDPPGLIVSGVFAPSPSGACVELDVWDTAKRAVVDHLSLAAPEGLGACALRLEAELRERLFRRGLAAPAEDPGFYLSPSPQAQQAYLMVLAQLLMHALAADKMAGSGALWNEVGMIESYYYYCEQNPQAVVPKLIAICGALCSAKAGLPVAEQHKQYLLKLIAAEKEAGPVSLLSPLVFLRLGEERAFEIARERLSRQPDPAYHAWLCALSR
ncbi:MAG: tetratricopeptide repeat protein [Elusimicrobia bacterium]|nr:tetratricopeptide repeat protein [Elusimicrobiota bacterium]